VTEMGWARNMYGGEEGCMQDFSGETWGERDSLKDPGVDERIILKWILQEWSEGHGLDRSSSG
jgi:hypothetical protein